MPVCRFRNFTTCTLVLMVATSVAHAGLQVSAWDLKTSAVELGKSSTVTQDVVTLPFLRSIFNEPPDGDVAQPGPNSATSAISGYDFSTTECSGSFLFEFDHGCSNAVDAMASSHGSITFMAVGGNLLYDLSGVNTGLTSYFVSGASFSHFEIGLYDVTDDVYLFQNIQEGTTPDWVYALGELGPDSNVLVGNMSGILPVGHTMRLEYRFSVDHALGSTSATGFGHMDFNVQTGSTLTIVCPADATLSCGDPTDPAHTGSAVASDPCSATVTFFDDRTDGPCPDSYSIARTWVATNLVGDQATCVQRLAASDHTAPVLNGCPADATVAAGAVPPPAQVTATDECDPQPGVSFSERVSGGGDCTGGSQVVRTWTATDRCGNSASCTQTITVGGSGNTGATISCPADRQLACGESSDPSHTGSATATAGDGSALPVTHTDGPTAANCTGLAGIDRTWSVNDGCGGVVSCVQHLTFVDTTAPVLNAPADVNLACGTALDLSQTGTATATDNSGAVTVTHSDAASAPGCTGRAGVDRTWTATDACGNQASSVQHIRYIDTNPPTFAGVGAAQTIECPAVPQFSQPTVSDNCDANPSMTFADSDTPLNCAQSHRVTRTWTARDACGNTSTASQTITVVDRTAPVLQGVPTAANTTIPCGGAVPPPPTVTATDHCDGNVAVVFGETQSANVLTRTWTATDACGNVARHTQTITRSANGLVLQCPPDVQVRCGDSTNPSHTGRATASNPCSNHPVHVQHCDAAAPEDANGHAVIARTWTATSGGTSQSCVQRITLLGATSCNDGDFNNTRIARGRTVWFSAVVRPSDTPVTIRLTNSTIRFRANQTNYVIPAPDAVVTYSSQATHASTVFDAASNTWFTTVPTRYSDMVFLTGVAYAVPVALPGGIDNVHWCGDFESSDRDVSLRWKWGAAVYTRFAADPNAIGVKPIDGRPMSPYANNDDAGTPELYKSFVTGGARGNGGSNWTGTLTAAENIRRCR